MYFAFPAEPSRSLSTLTSQTATAVKGEKEEEEEDEEEEEEEGRKGERKAGKKQWGWNAEQWESVKKKPQDADCWSAFKCFSTMTWNTCKVWVISDSMLFSLFTIYESNRI